MTPMFKRARSGRRMYERIFGRRGMGEADKERFVVKYPHEADRI